MGSLEDRKALNKEIIGLLRKARSAYVGERAEAESELSELGPAGTDALFKLVNTKSRLWVRRRRAYFSLVALFCCVVLPIMVYYIYQGIQAGLAGDGQALGGYFGMAFGGILGGYGGGILGGFAWLLTPPNELVSSANLLAGLDDVRSISPLIRVLSSRMMDFNLRYAAAEALCRLLPQIRDENAGTLDAEDRRILARYLLRSMPHKEEKLVLAILGALSKSGDTETLGVLRAFERRTKGKTREVAAEAIRCLDERLSRAAKTENLVRAAAPTDVVTALLRPASGDRREDPALLLRATTTNDS